MSQGDNFEFDKIMLAIAIGVCTVLLSSNIGDLLYNPRPSDFKRGFQIEVAETNTDSGISAVAELPAVLDMKAIMAAADAVKGATIFKKCATCHVSEKNGVNKVGPNLWGIVGTKTAAREGFAYSAAMMQRGSEGKTWGYEDLYRYLFSPKKFVPGTKMAFAGIKNDQERADLIKYLHDNADNPAPLP